MPYCPPEYVRETEIRHTEHRRRDQRKHYCINVNPIIIITIWRLLQEKKKKRKWVNAHQKRQKLFKSPNAGRRYPLRIPILRSRGLNHETRYFINIIHLSHFFHNIIQMIRVTNFYSKFDIGFSFNRRAKYPG